MSFHTDEIQVVEVDRDELENFRADPEFNYVESEARYTNWVAQLINWFKKLFDSLFGNNGTSNVMRVIFYILAIAGLLFLIIRLAGVQLNTLVKRAPATSGLRDMLVGEDIHQLDFEALIKQSLDDHNYREAIRWLYLFALRKLSDEDLITWTPGKTNHDYLHELAATPHGNTFQSLSYYFEYIWYGNFEIPPQLFARVEQMFEEFSHQISKKS